MELMATDICLVSDRSLLPFIWKPCEPSGARFTGIALMLHLITTYALHIPLYMYQMFNHSSFYFKVFVSGAESKYSLEKNNQCSNSNFPIIGAHQLSKQMLSPLKRKDILFYVYE